MRRNNEKPSQNLFTFRKLMKKKLMKNTYLLYNTKKSKSFHNKPINFAENQFL